jgi:histone H3/H4
MANTSKRLIPLAAMERILKQAGAERVSDKAKAALKEVIEGMAEKISGDAVRFAAHAGRKTIKSGDIKLAIK